MKILHVFYSFLPDLSGSSIRSEGLVRGQIHQGIPLALITSPFQPGFTDARIESYQGLPLYRAFRKGNPCIKESGTSLFARIRKVLLFPAFVLQILKAARREKADILHAHSTFYCGLAAFLAARLSGRRFIYEFRSLWEERNRARGGIHALQARLSSSLETFTLRRADQIVTINEGLRQEIIGRGIPGNKVRVVPNAVEDSLLTTARTLEAPQSFRRFGYIGNFSHIEGLETLIEGFCLAFPDGEPVELVFHGLGAYEESLKRLIAATQDPRIQFHGRFNREDLVRVYGSVDVIVIPRKRLKINETVTPLKPLEAMAFSRLVVVSDVGGLVEVLGGPDHGLIFRSEDAQDLAWILKQLYGGGPDRSQMAACGCAFVNQERSWSTIAGRYRAIYSDILPLPR